MKCRCGASMAGDGKTIVWHCPQVHFAPRCYPAPASEPVPCHRGEAAHYALVTNHRRNRTQQPSSQGAF